MAQSGCRVLSLLTGKAPGHQAHAHRAPPKADPDCLVDKNGGGIYTILIFAEQRNIRPVAISRR